METSVGDLNLDRILADLHYFLKAYPSYTWKARQTDMPLRTVKTILNKFVNMKGNKVCCAQDGRHIASSNGCFTLARVFAASTRSEYSRGRFRLCVHTDANASTRANYSRECSRTLALQMHYSRE